MLVKDVMKKNPFTIEPSVSVLDAKDIMTKNKVNKLPVVDKSGRLVGIITKNDLQRSSPSEATTLDFYELSYLLSKLTVEKAMVKEVATVSDNEPVEEAARIMADKGIGCLPVMHEDLLVGIITESDLFKLFIEMFNARTSGVRAVISLEEKPGALSAFAQKIADAGGNIVSLVTSPAQDASHRNVTVKVTDITEEEFKSAGSACSANIIDIRIVNTTC